MPKKSLAELKKTQSLLAGKGLLDAEGSHRHEEDLDIGSTMASCKEEIERAKKEVLTYKKQSLMTQLKSILGKLTGPPMALGENIYRIHPTKVAEKVLKRLHKDPTSMSTRLELIMIVRKSGKTLTYENQKILFLQSNIACSFGEMSPQAIQIVLTNQERFFAKLVEKCQSEIVWYEEKTQNPSNSETYQTQLLYMKEKINALKGVKAVYFAYQKLSHRGLQGKRELPGVGIDASSILSMEELQSYATEEIAEQSKRDETKKAIMKKAREVAFAVRYTPFLHSASRSLFDTIIKLDNENPLTYFFQARITMTALTFSVSHYQGERTPEIAKKVQAAFKDTYQYYNIAVNKIGPSTKSSTDFTILIEFGNLVHYYYKITTSLLRLKPPKDWLKGVFGKAEAALITAHESGKTETLLRDIHNDMIAEEINVS